MPKITTVVINSESRDLGINDPRCQFVEAYIDDSLVCFGTAFDTTGKGMWVFKFNELIERQSRQPKAVIKAARSLLRKQVRSQIEC